MGHVGFGTGIHMRAGQNLARLEGEVVLAALEKKTGSSGPTDPAHEDALEPTISRAPADAFALKHNAKWRLQSRCRLKNETHRISNQAGKDGS